MVQALRKPEIINIARREGRVTVESLVEVFGVTPQTIRRDLTELAEAGQLERVHGGAMLPSNTENIAYTERRRLNHASKVDIARECAKHIPNDSSVFLNIGTTTEAVAAELTNHKGLLVVTNNLNIAVNLSGHPEIDVIVAGGNLRGSDGGMTGEITRDVISQFRFDFAVIGCSALHEDGDILDFDTQEVGVSRAILSRSEKVFLVADASKFERKAPARIASMSDLDAIFTDREPPTKCVDFCRQSQTRIVVAKDRGQAL